MDSKPTYDRAEYERLTREFHAGQRKLLPRRTFRQMVADEWITVLAVAMVIVIPMALALKGAIF